MGKKNTGLIVLVVILSILVVGLSGFIIYDKVLSNNLKSGNNQENANVPNDVKEEELWLNDTLVQDLYSMVTFPGDNILGNWYFYENEKITLDNISNDTKLWMAYTQLNDNDIKVNMDDNNSTGTRSFDINKFDVAMKEVFGTNIVYTKDKFMPVSCDCEYEYSNNEKKYICGIGGCGGPGNSYIDSKLYRAFKINDEMILYEKFAYINIDEIIYDNSEPKYIGPKAGIYKDVKSEKVIKNWVKDIDYNAYYEPSYNFDDYINEMSMVKYTFKKGDDDSYHFYSSEIVENF